MFPFFAAVAIMATAISVAVSTVKHDQKEAQHAAAFPGYVDVTSLAPAVIPLKKDKDDSPDWLYLDHLGYRIVNPAALASVCPELTTLLPDQAAVEPVDHAELARWVNYSWGHMVRVEGLTLPMSAMRSADRCPWLQTSASGAIGIDGRHLVVLQKLRPVTSGNGPKA